MSAVRSSRKAVAQGGCRRAGRSAGRRPLITALDGYKGPKGLMRHQGLGIPPEWSGGHHRVRAEAYHVPTWDFGFGGSPFWEVVVYNFSFYLTFLSVLRLPFWKFDVTL